LFFFVVSPQKRGPLLICMFINFLLLPLTIFFLTLLFFTVSSVAFVVAFNEKVVLKKKLSTYFHSSKWYGGKLLTVFMLFFEISIALALAIAATGIVTVIVIGPAYIVQLFKLF
jgi:hypothetical protein